VRLLELAESDEGRTVLLPVLCDDVPRVADVVERHPHDEAQAVTASEKHDAMLGTYQRSHYATVVDGYDILDL